MRCPRSRSRQGSGQQYDEINLRKGGNRFLHAQPPNPVGPGQQTGRIRRKRNKIYCTEYQSVQYRYISNLIFSHRRRKPAFFSFHCLSSVLPYGVIFQKPVYVPSNTCGTSCRNFLYPASVFSSQIRFKNSAFFSSNSFSVNIPA